MNRRQLAQVSFVLFLTILLTKLLSNSQTRSSTFGVRQDTDMPPPLKQPVIVVGSGLAGLTAAFTAIQAGASVRMLDRGAKPGGNSIKASSGINGAYTRFQAASGIASDTMFFEDSVKSAGNRYSEAGSGVDSVLVDREGLVRLLTEQSKHAVEWLADEIGVDLGVVATLGGHSVPRTHRGAGKLPPGAALVNGLLAKLKETPEFQLTSAAEVMKVTTETETGHVTGVEYTVNGELRNLAGPVVFAAGGFAGDTYGLLARYRPDLAGFPATAEERPGAQDILVAIGAELVDMDSVQIHPTGFIDPANERSRSKFLAAEVLRGEGGILLDSSGNRFVNELDLRSVVSDAIMKTPQNVAEGIKQWDISIVLDPGASEALASHLGFYTWKGLMQKRKVKDLPPAFINSLKEYSDIVAGNVEDPLGRTSFGYWKLNPEQEGFEETEVYIGKITPVVHFTMGGVAFDTKGRVLKRDGTGGELTPIAGLFAAGEITGGIHGDNRLGGSSLLECVVYGRIAGEAAADELKAT
ncbi:hypothetical protein Cpir12675_002137 [Ceratocystis pirilliformis]|uniref:Fumarate reductase n=1 Tax=Ceratocystis pirilliformis TaxID=259994 RepID=A0ABR3ZE48_9PEZI